MTPRQRVCATLEFGGPDRLPRDLWGERCVGKFYPDKWKRVLERFPLDFVRCPAVLGLSSRGSNLEYHEGVRSDEWGSLWQSLDRGVSGEVIAPVLDGWEELASCEPPTEMLERPSIELVNSFCSSTDMFRLGEVGSGPFERLQFLRGVTNLYMDLADQPSELQKLIKLVHEFNLQHIRLWCLTDVDGITMGDDWGSQRSLLVSPQLWRKMFRPLYSEYFDLIHQSGKYVFFHSDGMIRPIFQDLIDIGTDAINAQLFCMDIEELGESFRGKVTFWGEIDRQFILPFGSEQDVRQAVRRAYNALAGDEGGQIAQTAWTIDTPTDNIMVAFDEWMRL